MLDLVLLSVLLCTWVSLKICAQDVRLIIQSLFSGYDEEFTPLSFSFNCTLAFAKCITTSATTIKVCSYSEIIMQESKHQREDNINGIKYDAS